VRTEKSIIRYDTQWHTCPLRRAVTGVAINAVDTCRTVRTLMIDAVVHVLLAVLADETCHSNISHLSTPVLIITTITRGASSRLKYGGSSPQAAFSSLSYSSSSFYLLIKQFHKNMTADNTRTGPTRLAEHSQWPQ